MTQIEAREIRGLLQRDLTSLLHKLFPHDPVTHPIMTPRNPTRDDRKPGSFVIWTDGAAAGGFNEYSPKGPQASGDVVDLVAYVHKRPGDRAFAFAWARDFLGLKTMSDGMKRTVKRQAQSHVQQVTAAQSAQSAERRKKAMAIWTRTLPLAGSTAETYLASRRIPYMLIQNREADLRFYPRLEHWKSSLYDRKTTPWTRLNEPLFFPAMVGAMRNLKGDITAVHCTFLRADGSGKADVAEPKLMRGDAKGSAIRLTRGGGDLPLDEARAAGLLQTLMPFEGIENALSYAHEVPEPRIWACGSFDLMMALRVEDEPAFDAVIFGADNDGNPNAAETLIDRIDEVRGSGRSCSIARPPHGVKDFNDLIREDD